MPVPTAAVAAHIRRHRQPDGAVGILSRLAEPGNHRRLAWIAIREGQAARARGADASMWVQAARLSRAAARIGGAP